MKKLENSDNLDKNDDNIKVSPIQSNNLCSEAESQLNQDNNLENEVNTTKEEPTTIQTSDSSLTSNGKSIAEQRLDCIKEQNEKAADSSTYEKYLFESYNNINVFAARRIGTGHIRKRTLCQDYCRVETLNNCIILTAADGVGSQINSDKGSKIACNSVVSLVENLIEFCKGDEDRIVKNLLSDNFREQLVKKWIHSVVEEIKKNGNSKDLSKEIVTYSSTIMLAVITKNWIVSVNLGDGQILVFNDDNGVELRVHSTKESSLVRALVQKHCKFAQPEHFSIAKYPRNIFTGVLLTTDGMYDALGNANLFKYAIEAKKRFILNKSPYQAFCDTNQDGEYMDVSRRLTQDDCSVVMAVDMTENIPSNFKVINNSLSERFDINIFNRWSPLNASFCTYKKSGENEWGESEVVVQKKDSEIALTNEQQDFLADYLVNPQETWNCEEYIFKKYVDKNPFKKVEDNSQFFTIEQLNASRILPFSSDEERIESDIRFYRTYLKLKNLSQELKKVDLELNSSALFNVIFDDEHIYLRKEALSSVANKPSSEEDINIIELQFSHLIGALVSEKNENSFIPIINVCPLNNTIGGTTKDKKLFELLRTNNELFLKNISSYSWKCEDGKEIKLNEIKKISNGMRFDLLDSEGNKIEEYKYIAKDELCK